MFRPHERQAFGLGYWVSGRESIGSLNDFSARAVVNFVAAVDNQEVALDP